MRPLVGSLNLKAHNAAIQLRILGYRSLIAVPHEQRQHSVVHPAGL